MDSDLSIRDISMTFDDDDTVIRSMSDEGDEDEAVLTRLPSHQWKEIIDFLTVEDFKALRLTGSKALPNLTDPQFTSHLQLRMDKASFFFDGYDYSEQEVRRWLSKRTRLVINDGNANISKRRVAYMVQHGFMDSVTDIIAANCHRHSEVLRQLSKLPNVNSLKILDSGVPSDDEDDEGEQSSIASLDGNLEELEAIIEVIGNMKSLTSLDVEFDTVVSGSRLTFLQGMVNLKFLRLRGFDLSEGLRHISELHSLEELHLCHGNFYSSPSNDVNEKDLLHLKGLQHITSLHLEGFDCLSGVGMSPFVSNSITDLVLKHCQESSEDCLSAIGRMTKLKSLHMINNECDDAPIFGSENLHHLNMLSELKALSLFYVFEEPSDLSCLKGLTSLESLNLAYEYPMEDDEIEEVIIPLLSTFPHLRKLRIFSPDGMAYSLKNGSLDIEFSSYSFGDLVHLD
eukprot:scaffold2556_cov153-Skeletonema_menzelii.AAC.12